MLERPTLETARLILRPFTLADAPEVQRLASDRAIASTTLSIAHPYEAGMAERWISGQQAKFERGTQIHFAITRRADGALLGDILLYPTPAHRRAELGYWLGTPYWGQGYTSEAAAAVLDYAFTVLDLHRVFAEHLTRNPASGRVLQKIGMTYEGTLRHHTLKWDIFEDVAVYGILHDEWLARADRP
jgi:ribosomal-protein-alanine N-acetyltransferase